MGEAAPMILRNTALAATAAAEYASKQPTRYSGKVWKMSDMAKVNGRRLVSGTAQCTCLSAAQPNTKKAMGETSANLILRGNRISGS
ncbi:uncharacterized protein PG986_004634 [Apiospora aurea]|uniref:Uncharacterized protein n=1 Tax=Apiospora aurea TaxID=335848 RepID=A0ABR1QN59_9PEZI